LGYIEGLAIILVALVLADRVLALWGAVVRVVAKTVPAGKVLNRVRNDMLNGLHGLGSIVYHRESGRMIIATKCLTPNYLSRGAVRLHVTLKRVAPPKRWRVDMARGLLSKDGNYYSFVWYWHLPSCRKGEVLFEEECGASITKLEEVVQQLIADEQSLGPNPVFYIWLDSGRKGSRIYGTFEDLGKTEVHQQD